MGPIVNPHAIAGRLQIAQQLLHAGQYAWRRVVVMRDVITEDPGDAFSCSATTSGHIESKSSLASIRSRIRRSRRGRRRRRCGRRSRRRICLQGMPVSANPATPAEIETTSVMVGTKRSSGNPFLIACVCLPPVYRTHVREGRFARVRHFLKVIGAERLAWVLKRLIWTFSAIAMIVMPTISGTYNQSEIKSTCCLNRRCPSGKH